MGAFRKHRPPQAVNASIKEYLRPEAALVDLETVAPDAR